MKRMVVVLAGMAVLMMLAAPAFAHNMVVTNPKTGEAVNERWIGGGGGENWPAQAQDAPPMFGPHRLPPSHGTGLVSACHGTGANGAVSILAPPFFTGCEHGQP